MFRALSLRERDRARARETPTMRSLECCSVDQRQAHTQSCTALALHACQDLHLHPSLIMQMNRRCIEIASTLIDGGGEGL